jgi:glucan biosynthesis protein C
MNKIFYRKPLFSSSVSPYVFKLPSTASLKKDQNVETLRGSAIILVVFGHMIAGMRVSDDSIFWYIHYSLGYIRMPLFTIISGWLYANKPILNNQSRFIKGKLRRLILPMFVISTLLFFSRMIIPGTNYNPEISDLPRNIILPYDVYWYLYSLFLIFLVITVLDTQRFFHRIEGWSITLISSFVILFITENFLDEIPNLFSFKGAAYLFPFFLMGIGIFRFKDFLLNDKMTFLLLPVFVAGIIIQQMTWFGYFPIQEKHSVLGMTVGITSILLLFKLKLKNNLLTWIGGYAYGIFLFHVFFTGGTRIVLLKTGIENQWTIAILGVLSAILFSILAETVISKFNVSRFYFLGLKRNEK